jgi:hypothetical protein
VSLKVIGRAAGALFLLAIACYGTGSALGGGIAGTALMLANSGIVAAIAVLFFLAFGQPRPRAAWIYLVARSAEAILLAVGVVLLTSAQKGGADVAYQLGMLALGLGSMPAYVALARARLLPRWLAGWGFAGYALLAVASVAQLMGLGIGLVLSFPGLLFEIVLGIALLYRGFPDRHPAPATSPAVRARMATVAAPEAHLRRASMTAGLGLLVMAILAGLANFGVIERLVGDNAAQTTQRLLQHQQSFQLAIAGLFAVACLDVIVAWALYAFFNQSGRAAAQLSAWLRTGYAVAFIIAIAHLLVAATLLHKEAPPGTAAATGRFSDKVFSQVSQFQDIWQLALILFAMHLLLIGWLALRSGRLPRWVAALVAIAGAGYLADSVGPLLWSGYTIQLTAVTFVGEVALMVWLLIFAVRKPSRTMPSATVEPPREPQLT